MLLQKGTTAGCSMKILKEIHTNLLQILHRNITIKPHANTNIIANTYSFVILYYFCVVIV